MFKELSLLTRGSLPMVAFGTPMRNWIKQHYGQTSGMLGLGQISPAVGETVSVLGANRLCYIWYAADTATYDDDE